jgi:dimethylhistidine N-methyltransferase
MLGQAQPGQSSRFVMHKIAAHQQARSFGEDVRIGLTSDPKTLPSKYFYDDLGSRLFEAICCLPEYYLTRAESEILCTYAGEIIAELQANSRQPIRLIELGSGNAEKTRLLIEAAIARQGDLLYIPVDISAESLQSSFHGLVHEYPQLQISALAADYFAALDCFSTEGIPGGKGFSNVFLFLGSNIGNFDAAESRAFLGEIRKVLGPGDALLLGADLNKGADLLVPAYDDQLGVTAAFNRNLLVRINQELQADFDLSKFDHIAMYDATQSRVEMHLVSREPQQVRIGALDLTVRFDWRESIHTESSYKYDLETLAQLGQDAGFSVKNTWYDSAAQFSFNLFLAA